MTFFHATYRTLLSKTQRQSVAHCSLQVHPFSNNITRDRCKSRKFFFRWQSKGFFPPGEKGGPRSSQDFLGGQNPFFVNRAGPIKKWISTSFHIPVSALRIKIPSWPIRRVSDTASRCSRVSSIRRRYLTQFGLVKVHVIRQIRVVPSRSI